MTKFGLMTQSAYVQLVEDEVFNL